MRTHQSRPVVQELDALYAIAVREHGPRSRASWLIGRALEETRRADADQAARAQAREGRGGRSDDGPARPRPERG